MACRIMLKLRCGDGSISGELECIRGLLLLMRL